jgi:hypothetical protein
MQKRLKATCKVEQRDFNNRRFQEDNPFFVGTKSPALGMASIKYEEEEEAPRPDHFQLNREKIFNVRLVQAGVIMLLLDRIKAILAS